MSAEDRATHADAALEDETRALARLRTGEKQVYEGLVRTYTGRLLAVAQRILRTGRVRPTPCRTHSWPFSGRLKDSVGTVGFQRGCMESLPTCRIGRIARRPKE